MSLLLLFAGARAGGGATTTATGGSTGLPVISVGLSSSKAQGVYLPAPSESQLRNVIRTVYALARGGSNSKGTFTLSSTGATSLTVGHVNCSPTSIIAWTPVTQSAAAQMMTLYALSSNITTGSFTVTQASNTSTSAVFNYVLHS